MPAGNVLINIQKANDTLKYAQGPTLTDTEHIAMAQVYALLAIAEAIYESIDSDKIAKAIEDGLHEVAMEK